MSENEDEFRGVVSKRTVFLIDMEPNHVQTLGYKTIGLLLDCCFERNCKILK